MQLGITGFMISIMLSDFLSGVTVWRIAGHSRFLSRRFIDRELLEVMVRFSLPLIPTAVLWIITGFSDRIFIRHIMTASDAGIYGAAAKIPNLISMVSTVFYQAWNMSAIAENDSKGRAQFYTRVYDAYQAMLTLAAGAIIFLVQPLSAVVIDYSLDPAYERAYLYTPTLVIAVLFMCFNQFLSSIYTVTKHTKNSFYSSFAAAVINLCLNGFLIADHGIIGAIVATIASYLVCYIIRVRDTGRFIPFRINHLRTAANLGILTVMCAVTHYTDKSLATPMPAMVSVLLNTLCMIGLAVINFNPLMTTFKKVLRR
jgi:O-antigen/teichoic acid export membrane protein